MNHNGAYEEEKLMTLLDKVNGIIQTNSELQANIDRYVQCAFEGAAIGLFNQIEKNIMQTAQTLIESKHDEKKVISGQLYLGDSVSYTIPSNKEDDYVRIFSNSQKKHWEDKYPYIGFKLSCDDYSSEYYLILRELTGKKVIKSHKSILKNDVHATVYYFIDKNGIKILDLLRKKADEQGVTIAYDLKIKDAGNEIFIPDNSEYNHKNYRNGSDGPTIRIKYRIELP